MIPPFSPQIRWKIGKYPPSKAININTLYIVGYIQ
jgi:hypothetical protein